MDLIPDTCALLSLAGIAERKLTEGTLQMISSAEHVYVSACSLFEISLKFKRDRLNLGRFDFTMDFWDEAVETYALVELPVLSVDFHSAVGLPDYHLDPFDRIIIAQAMRTASEIVTYDHCFAQYAVRWRD